MLVEHKKVKFNIQLMHNGQGYSQGSEVWLPTDVVEDLLNFHVEVYVKPHYGSLGVGEYSIADKAKEKRCAVTVLDGKPKMMEVTHKKNLKDNTLEKEVENKAMEMAQKMFQSFMTMAKASVGETKSEPAQEVKIEKQGK